ncbi:putative transmembrane Protein, tadG1 [Burkholderia pseudomallei MSHR2990]|nr:putative transmembrane Protein, tadG1 [Burkholderia pseudomallei MSHR2990]
MRSSNEAPRASRARRARRGVARVRARLSVHDARVVRHRRHEPPALRQGRDHQREPRGRARGRRRARAATGRDRHHKHRAVVRAGQPRERRHGRRARRQRRPVGRHVARQPVEGDRQLHISGPRARLRAERADRADHADGRDGDEL